MPDRILIIEDGRPMRRILQLVLESGGYRVETAVDGNDGVLKWKTFQPDAVFTDLKMPGADGMKILNYRNLKHPDVPVIVLTAFGSVSTAVEAMKKGAFDYITKPVDNRTVLEKARAALKSRRPEKRTPNRPPLFLGPSKVMTELKRRLALVAPTSTSVLITGASGTGKELAARTLHALSPRRNAPFVKVNCAAIPPGLMESELFGHVRGAFTGAENNRRGAFVQAESGTLFLDEIGDLPYELQAKLLHAVEDKAVVPLGSARATTVDVRIITATNHDIDSMVTRSRFRPDLYFRINTYRIEMPLLKNRLEDLPELSEHFLELISRDFGREKLLLPPEAMAVLKRHTWPGNVRELRNTLERLALVSEGMELSKATVESLLGPPTGTPRDVSREPHLFAREKEMIYLALMTRRWLAFPGGIGPIPPYPQKRHRPLPQLPTTSPRLRFMSCRANAPWPRITRPSDVSTWMEFHLHREEFHRLRSPLI